MNGLPSFIALIFYQFMKRTIALIGIVILGTFFAVILSSGATSYLYNKTWLVNNNEIPECLMSASTAMNCPHVDGEYFSGLFWWSNFVGIAILTVGAIFVVVIYKKRHVMRIN